VKFPHRIPPKDNKLRHIGTIRLEHPRTRPRDGPTLQTYACQKCLPHETSTHSWGSARPSQLQQLQRRDMQQLQQRHLHLPDLQLHSRLRDMRGTSSSYPVQPKARSDSKPAHIPAAIGTGSAPNRHTDDAPAAPEPSTRVSVHAQRPLPIKHQKPRIST